MAVSTQIVGFDGGFLQRGYWLYVWQVTDPTGRELLYVGRTGDSSSPNAQSPFNRMGQHLGSAVNSSMLRNHLSALGLEPRDCAFRLIAHGPVLSEPPGKDMAEHRVRRDLVAGIEKRLAEELKGAGYDVVNTVTSTKTLDEDLYAGVRAAFAVCFPRLSEET